MRKSRRALFAICLASLLPLWLLGCPNKPAPVADAAPAPTPTPIQTETVLVPIEDAAVDDAADAAKKYTGTGTGMNANQIRAKQCCNALRGQAKNMGNSPEAAQINAAAAVCDQAAMSLGPTAGGQAPELAPMRAMLQGKTIPPLCQGL